MKAKKLISKNGYISILAEKHPASRGWGYLPEHRLVMEKKIGRYLCGTEVVHHIDGNKHNNNISNLKLYPSEVEHQRIHNGWEEINGKWFKPCSRCKEVMEVSTENFYFRKCGRVIANCKSCSNTICGNFNRKRNKKNGIEPRKYRYITYKGETKTVTEWSSLIGVKRVALYTRLKRGWSIERTLSTKTQHCGGLHERKKKRQHGRDNHSAR